MINSSWMKNSLLRNERILHAGMAILMVLGIAGCFLVHSTIAQYVDAIASNFDECTSLRNSEREFTDAVAQAQERLEQLEKEYRSILDRIPSKIVDSEILSSVRGLALSSHCNLLDFRPAANQRHKEFLTRSFELHLEGGFKSLFQFFDALQSVPYIYQVARFKVSESSNPNGLCRFELELKVVFDHIWAQSE